MSNKIYFDVEDNIVVKHTPILGYGENIYESEIVMDKETFIKCYESWIAKESEK